MATRVFSNQNHNNRSLDTTTRQQDTSLNTPHSPRESTNKNTGEMDSRPKFGRVHTT